MILLLFCEGSDIQLFQLTLSDESLGLRDKTTG